MATHNLLPDQQNYLPQPKSMVTHWVVRGFTGACTHGVITRWVPRDQQPVCLLLGVFAGIVLSTSDDSRIRAMGHGVLGGTATSTVNFFWPSSPPTAYRRISREHD